MTQEQLPDAQLPPGPVLGYWLARVNGEDRNKAAKVLQTGIDRKIDEIMHQVETIEKGLGFRRQPDPVKRLAAHLNKPETYAEAVAIQQAAMLRYQEWQMAGSQGEAPQVPPIWSWETQRAYLPKDYEEDWLDFQDLRARAEAGEFSKRTA